VTRSVLFDPAFRTSLRETLRWIAAHRPGLEVERLRAEVDRLTAHLGSFPRLGREVEVRGRSSVRVIPLRRLPYLVWYTFRPSARQGPVRLLLLLHEKQDRDRFDASLFEV